MERARLSAARNEQGWSQEYVAEQLGIDRVTVQRWEAGKTTPQPYHLLRLCKLFDKTPQELGLADETAPGTSHAVSPTILPDRSESIRHSGPTI